MKISADRSTIVVGSSLGILVLLVLYGVLSLWFLRQDFVAEIDNIQPRTARLLGMVESYEELESASDSASRILRELAYPASRDGASTAAAMQQDIRELMTAAGLSVSGSQILPRRKAESFDRLSLDISAEGNIDALEDALTSLEAMRPLVFVNSLNVKPSRASRSRRRSRDEEVVESGDPRTLTARFNLFSLRLQD